MKRLCKYIVLTLITLGAWSFSAQAQEQAPPKKARILFLLDASGSMFKEWEGSNRITIAKSLLTKLVDSLKAHDNLQIALRVYGHQYRNNCEDTKLEVPFGSNNHEAIKNKLKTIEPKGTTPLAYSLLQATKDFSAASTDDVRNIIIIITDGLESCDGDPCKISYQLQKKHIFLKPFIVGIGDPDENFKKAFECMGNYFDASNVHSFKKVMEKVIKQALSETKVIVNLLDINNQPTETNVNMTFMNSVTKEAIYDFVHYKKANGKSDELDVEPVITYDIVVQTIPQVVKRNVFLEGGTTNIINIKTPQGTLDINLPNDKEYKLVPSIIRKAGETQTLHIQNAGDEQKYLVGKYDVEVLTLPRTIIKNVEIKQSQTTTLDIDMPGVLSISERIEGYGSIYQVHKNGYEELIYNMPEKSSNIHVAMQPGNYKLVFRAKQTKGSQFTTVKYFTIRSGGTTPLKLFSQ